MKERILIIDDDERWRDMLADILSDDYEILQAQDGEQGIKKAKENDVNLILLDLMLPDINGIEVLKEIIKVKPSLPVIMISGYGSIQDAVTATKIGAYDFLEKPSDREKILLTVRNALEKERMRREITVLREEVFKKYEMIGVSQSMAAVFDKIEKSAPTKASILITGESGVGKELVARAIHNRSDRKDNPFVKINCAAIPKELIESELFGYEKGAFTDAKTQKKGKVEEADEGTLFLDEIADLSVPAQAKLLRFLQESEFERLGSTKTLKVDVRVIAATNKNLEHEIAEQRFREDLFYRLNVINIYVPPLRERKEDIPVLADYFVELVCEEHGVPKKILASDVIEFLKNQYWKGNIRELRNVIERAVILLKTPEINSSDLMKVMETSSKVIEINDKPLRDARDDFEREYIIKLLTKFDWNMTKTAEALEIDRAHLYRKLKELGITENKYQENTK